MYAIFNDQSFNDTLTNDIVSFEQLGPCNYFSYFSTKHILWVLIYVEKQEKYQYFFSWKMCIIWNYADFHIYPKTCTFIV